MNPEPKIYIGGMKRWFLRDKLHREDGPAIIYPGGRKDYYFYGIHSRVDDGPVIENYNNEPGYHIWKVGNPPKSADLNEYCEYYKLSEEKLVLKLKYG